MLLEEFLSQVVLRLDTRKVAKRPDGLMQGSATHYRYHITNQSGQAMSGYWSQGSAHTSPPTLYLVLDCLADDASSYENADSLADWAEELGYTDIRTAERTYKACQKVVEDLRALLGVGQYERLLWEVEK